MAKSKPGAEVRVVHMHGDYFEIGVRNHDLAVDQPHDDGTDDLAPSPTELFVASLAACAAFYARRFLVRHRLDDHVTVTAGWRAGDVPARVTDVTIDVFAPSLTAELHDRCMASVRRCTLKNTLDKPPDVAITLSASRLERTSARAS
jgi:uncharacterized OsmC-like protein